MAARLPIVSTDLNDALLRQNVLTQRLASQQVAKFAKFLRQQDAVIRQQLSGDELTDFTRARLEKLLKATDSLIEAILAKHTAELVTDLKAFGGHESGFVARVLEKLLDFDSVVPASSQVEAAIMSTPLSVRGTGGGKLLQAFLDDWTAAEVKAVNGIIRRGAFEGQTNSQIVRAIRGTKAANYADGALEVTARNAEAIVRTAVQHTSSVARGKTFDRNSDIVEKVQWVATLDKRTCPRCGGLDGLTFPADRGPRPPIHINCRCIVVPVLSDEFKDLDKGGTRASKGPEGGKQVPADETYYAWLSRQPAAFQDAAIGPARAKLLRDGGLSASRFAALQFDKRFEPLTLNEMKSLEPLAFSRASLD
jgi:SPP1 gp7 family putative phage head morphogenesis protein